MKKVAYLLGAGASANALPVANQIQVYLESFLALIQRKEKMNLITVNISLAKIQIQNQ
jgi:hypothetical protein